MAIVEEEEELTSNGSGFEGEVNLQPELPVTSFPLGPQQGLNGPQWSP